MPQPKSPLIHLYLDESGSRHPDRRAAIGKHGHDWFAIGGFLVNEEDEAGAKSKLLDFLKRWPQIRCPLHLTDIRAEQKGFSWLGKLKVEEREKIWSDYRTFLVSSPLAGVACVIDRPGYAARGYGKREGDKKWLLCRSAFDIVVERAAKFAQLNERRLRVFYERADPDTDARLENYFTNLKANGLAFSQSTSAQYQPFSASDFKRLLVSIEGKDKQNKMMQIADSYLYAFARGSYDAKFQMFRRIGEAGRLAASQVPGDQARFVAIKKYCFDSGGA